MTLSGLSFTLIVFVIAIGVLVFVHELGHFLVAKRLGVKVLRFSLGFGPILFARRRGETEYAISSMPLGGYVKMLGEDDDEGVAAEPGRAFGAQSLPKRSAIVFAGPAMNFLFAFLVYAGLFYFVGAEVPSDQPRVGSVTAGTPAARADLRAGDLVREVNGVPTTTWQALSSTVRQSNGAPLALTIERAGARQTITVVPELSDLPPLTGDGPTKGYLIGIGLPTDWREVGPFEAVGLAARQTVSATYMVGLGFVRMVQGRVSAKELGGPIAIAKVAGEQARSGARYYFSMLAFLSINLAVLNLFPIPALDGGHLAIFGIEGLLGRPLPQRQREVAQQVGLLLLLSLMVFVFYNDINRLVQG